MVLLFLDLEKVVGLGQDMGAVASVEECGHCSVAFRRGGSQGDLKSLCRVSHWVDPMKAGRQGSPSDIV